MKSLLRVLYNGLKETTLNGLLTIRDSTVSFVLAVIALAALVLLIPLMPFILIYLYFDQQKDQKEYNFYLQQINGAKFFCYNNRRNSVMFGKEVVVPALDPSIRVVFVDGEDIDCGPDSKHISKMLYEVKQHKGFPYLLKVVNGEVIDDSVNNLFYNTMTGSKPLEPLLARINEFYSSSKTISSN
jgi:hypothetical protein